jgi:hypothetical protein
MTTVTETKFRAKQIAGEVTYCQIKRRKEGEMQYLHDSPYALKHVVDSIVPRAVVWFVLDQCFQKPREHKPLRALCEVEAHQNPWLILTRSALRLVTLQNDRNRRWHCE